MSDLEDVYAARSIDEEAQAVQHQHDEPPEVEAESTGEEQSVPPTPEAETKEPEVDWRAEAEKARKLAEEAERKAKGLEQAIAAARQKVREQPQPSFNEDPAAYVERVQQDMQAQIRMVRIESAQTAARARHADYDEMEGVFASLAESNPYLVAQLQQQPDPAEFAYKTAKFHKEMQAVGGSVDDLKKQIEAQVRAEMSAQFQSKAQSLPKTLAGATGTGRSSASVYAGPVSLDDIYSTKRGK